MSDIFMRRVVYHSPKQYYVVPDIFKREYLLPLVCLRLAPPPSLPVVTQDAYSISNCIFACIFVMLFITGSGFFSFCVKTIVRTIILLCLFAHMPVFSSDLSQNCYAGTTF